MDNKIHMLSRVYAESILQKIIGCPLCYGLKSPDMDMYDVGFGECSIIRGFDNKIQLLSSFAVHASCCIKISDRENKSRASLYSGDNSPEEFHNEVEHLIGLQVKRIALSMKNDLWIDVGRYWLVFITYEDEEESWRFFSPEKDGSHLVVTSNSIIMTGDDFA